MVVVGDGKPRQIGAADLYFVKSAGVANKWVIALWQDFHTLDADSAQFTPGRRRLEAQGVQPFPRCSPFPA